VTEAGDAGDAGDAADASDDADAGPPYEPPDVVPSDPITAIDGVWTYVPFPDAYCRDGTPAHLMVHLNSKSKKFAIYEEGGGACFNDASCTFLSIDLPSYVLGGGIFNFLRPDNPIGDWNIFYVPYCTGDVHAGDIAMSNVGPVTGNQRFAGYSNLKLYLARILATMPDATDELLTGSSAGGFGAGLTADLVARNMPASVQRFTMLDDSGPPLSSTYVQPCLQDLWRKTWGLDTTFLHDCGSYCPTPDGWVTEYIDFLIAKYANGPLSGKFEAGLISSTSDAVISTFFGFGADKCSVTAPVAIPGAEFEAGLLEVRSHIQSQTSQFGTFYYGSTQHTTLLQDVGDGVLGGLYDTKVGDQKLVDWIANLLAHNPTSHVGP
jgi:hypothetical protein